MYTRPVSSAAEIAEQFRAFVGSGGLAPEGREVASAAITAFVAYDADQDPSVLPALLAAARDRRKAVVEVGAQLLALLARCFQPAQDAWRALARDRTVAARFAAIAFLDPEMPSELIEAVLEAGLSDKAAQVRAKTVEVATTLERRALVPAIERLVQDPDAKVRKEVEAWLPILRDGYRLEPGKEAGWWWISFCVPGSSISAPFQGNPTPEAIRAAIDAELARHRG